MARGSKSVRGYVESADLSTAAEVALFDENGDSVTLGENEQLVVSALYASVDPSSGTAILQVFADENDDNTADAGEIFFGAIFEAGTVLNAGGNMGGVVLPKGAKPHAVSSAAGVGRISLVGKVVSYS